MGRKAVSCAIFIFFAVCIFEVVTQREDWPFSYFGMYKRSMSPLDFYRIDVDIEHQGQKHSLYDIGVNHFYFYDKLNSILKSVKLDSSNLTISSPQALRESEEARIQIRSFLRDEVLPKLRRKGLVEGDILVRYRHWNEFKYENLKRPDIDRIVFRIPYVELEANETH